ncbi:MAG: EAL domain-containing protein [Candidatus Parabeggiatoa sp.]|nr:EAL domain-containing protein [Candidatus Parabeggiatoa sp.]
MPRKIPIKVDISLLLVAIIGLGLSLTAFFYVKQWEQDTALDEQKKQVNEHMRVLRQTFTTYGNILKSIRGLHHVHPPLTRQNFTQFIQGDLLTQPGIQAWSYVNVVPASKRQTIESSIRSEGFSEFHLWEYSSHFDRWTAGEREIYYPILFTEPLESNINLLGYDVGSNNILRIALENARDLGQMTTSGAVEVQTLRGKLMGIYVFIPVYQTNTIPATLTERRRDLIGFSVGIFLLDELVKTVLRLPKLRTEIFLVIFDDTIEAKIKELYVPNWYRGFIRKQSVSLWWGSLDFGGRQWRIVLYKTKEAALFHTWYAWTVLSIGLIFTLGLLRYLYIILTRAHWAEELVGKRTQNLYDTNLALNQEMTAREQMTQALKASQQRFQAIFNEAAIGIAQTNLEDKILDSNRVLQSLLRYRETELNQKLLKDFVHPEDAKADQFMLQKMLAGKYDTYQVSKRYICKSGAIVWTNQSCSIVRDTSHPFIINMIEDITERKFAEEARLEAENKYRDIFENAIEGIFQCTPTGRYLSVNPAFVRMFGYESAEQIYTEMTDIGQQLYVNPQRRLEFIALLEKHSNVQDFEYQARCRNGRIIWVNETVRVVRDTSDQIRYYEGIIENVTERKQTEEKLRHDATHDQLTGLCNRAAFTKRLTKALSEFSIAKLSESKINLKLKLEDQNQIKIPYAVLFIDLDRFKIVNDSMGHLVGDKLLTETAHRLARQAHENDIVARFGGDEFALMLENQADLASLEQRVEKIQQQLNQPYTLGDETFNTTASIGIALSDSKYSSSEEILRDADTAMYEAKKQGRGKSIIFQEGMHTNVVNMLRMERDLRIALEQQEFCLYYQPIISLETDKTVALEALVRWIHPEQGMIRPDLFIPLAEETGLIKELGLWVFETACFQLRQWQIQFPHHAELGMNINMSPIQFKQPHLINLIQDIIEKSGIKGSTCRVEITENAMMQDPEAALTILNELKNLELLLYIDDFGTGYSSLSYLQRYPIDALKIDRSFIKDIDTSSKSAQIADAIIALGEAFGLRIVAEGVENEQQAAILKLAHCHHVQGYFFSRPQDAKTLDEYLSIERHFI